ncbi:hypothetical protein JXL21_05605 [Candidatus Bathyarchaeota archaeon]|nr:hypothetical protein [Candidatus Bathyarchaeota archaeon]
MAYMVVAVALGYTLISAVPGQIAVYTEPPMLTTTESAPDEQGGRILSGEAGANATETPPEPEMYTDSEEDLTGSRPQVPEPMRLGVENTFEMYRWWALDLGIALSVYWVARRRFS